MHIHETADVARRGTVLAEGYSDAGSTPVSPDRSLKRHNPQDSPQERGCGLPRLPARRASGAGADLYRQDRRLGRRDHGRPNGARSSRSRRRQVSNLVHLLQSSRGRIRTSVEGTKSPSPAWLDDPGSRLAANFTGRWVRWLRTLRRAGSCIDVGSVAARVVRVNPRRDGWPHAVITSRNARRTRWSLCADSATTWRSLSAPACSTYGFVGYGDVSVMNSAKLGS